MPSENEPLLAHDRRSSEQSDERAAAEDEALHGTQSSNIRARNSYGFWRELALFIWAVAATTIVIVLAVVVQHNQQTLPDHGSHSNGSLMGKRNLIFMVSDGMGPA